MLVFFDQVWTYNIVSTFIILYILSLVLLGSHFASCDLLDRPLLLNSFNVYSIFFIFSLYLFFGFDFMLYDQIYYFNQCLQVLFLFFSIKSMFILFRFGFNSFYSPRGNKRNRVVFYKNIITWIESICKFEQGKVPQVRYNKNLFRFYIYYFRVFL